MRNVEIRLVRRRGRVLRWVVFSEGREQVRRALLDATTGEILDEVWRDADGRVRSWSKSRVDPSAAWDDAA